jgi:hypothetical protein
MQYIDSTLRIKHIYTNIKNIYTLLFKIIEKTNSLKFKICHVA